MKLYKKIIMLVFTVIVIALFKNTVYATETTQKLYQDIKINIDGSITVKEAAVLSGEYNGRLRNIEFKNKNSKIFSGIYSNFTGNTDIYDGSKITNIKIGDISKNNFSTINDINKIEKVYTRVDSASSGSYGVYKLTVSDYGADFKIFCPSTKNKVFYMEYTIEDAVVVHNDIAELYWNVMGTGYEERIADFQVLIHLPEEDNDVRIWTHGPLSGVNAIINKKTLSFKDRNVYPYTAETVRIMFDKELVPQATKKSGVNGRDNILKYEASQADMANAQREKNRLEEINTASSSVIRLKESPSMYTYNIALKYVNELPENTSEKEEMLSEIYSLRDIVNIEWKNRIESYISYLDLSDDYATLSADIRKIEEYIDEGFDEEYKEIYSEQLVPYRKELHKKEIKIRVASIIGVIILAGVGIVFCGKDSFKQLKDKKAFNQRYYRGFPNGYPPYVIEYLMKGRVTNLSVSATILGLIANKVIKIEEKPNSRGKNYVVLVYVDKNCSGTDDSYGQTDAENEILKLLFNKVGKNGRCNLEILKNYGKKSESKAKSIINSIDKFKKYATEESESMSFFEKNKGKALKIIYLIFMFICMMVLTANVSLGTLDSEIISVRYVLICLLLSITLFFMTITSKKRTPEGALEYSKWLAHKRFLQDFSKFDEKELPEIKLWEKYMVTATILGCADKVQKAMKLKIANVSEYDDNFFMDMYLINSMNRDLTRTINRAVNSSISTANSTIYAESSGGYGGSSSGGGFGGGSSFGGGGGGRRWRWRPFLKNKNE